MELRHKADGWVMDKANDNYYRIVQIIPLSSDDQQWLNHGAPAEPMYSLALKVGASIPFTQYLTVAELNELYPYIGKDIASIEVLYG